MKNKETYEQYKSRNGITHEYQASIQLGLDAVNLISSNLIKSREVLKNRQ